MLTLKTSVAAAILVGVMAATAGVTYVAARTSVSVSCPAAVAALPRKRGRTCPRDQCSH